MNGHPSRLRALVVEDDPDTAVFVRHVLERAGFHVLAVSTASAALRAPGLNDVDVALTDIEIPDGNGLDLAAALIRRGIPVAVTTAYSTVDRAVTALRCSVSEFLPKPVPSGELVSTLTRLGAETARRRVAASRRRVLAIGAHPDDVEIGTGGILAAHAAAGDEIVVVTLSRGARGGDTARRVAEAHAAADLLGARLVLGDLEDTCIPEGNPTVDLVEAVVREVEPAIAYTHSVHDLHQDHRAVHRASLVATRSVPTVACYQSPSATVDFRPTRFVDVSGHLDAKLGLVRCFGSQSDRGYLADDLLRSTARYWSRHTHTSYAEPLEIVRERTCVTPSGENATTTRPARRSTDVA